ncbi:MAG: hypothetical protein LBU19_08970 [Treponema sp.]|jgi:hypothetical protein|nr:hypothetical protein [Treponema sp.]
MKMTAGENEQLANIISMVNRLKKFFDSSSIDKADNVRQIYTYINEIKNIQGNLSSAISYVSCLMAKEYLLENYNISNIDVSIKSQSANGLDIDEKLNDGKRIIAEIKTIFPYEDNDFGAKQKESFRSDFKKLNGTPADYKILFVTESKTFQILNRKYLSELKNVKIVLLK